VALEPSISLGVFGLTLLEILTAGAWAEFKNILHLLRLYRSGNCICHGSVAPPKSSAREFPDPEAAPPKGENGHMRKS
jgi:hypothetical protein